MCRGCEGWAEDRDGNMIRLYQCSFCEQHANTIDAITHSASVKCFGFSAITEDDKNKGYIKVETDELGKHKMRPALNCNGNHQIHKNPYLNDDGSEKSTLCAIV